MVIKLDMFLAKFFFFFFFGEPRPRGLREKAFIKEHQITEEELYPLERPQAKQLDQIKF